MPKPPSLRQIAEIEVFVSSSSEPEALYLREEINRLATRLNVALRETSQPFSLGIYHWYQQPAGKAPPRKVNQVFVDRALRSAAVFALLIRLLRPGTKQEVKAVYASNVPLSVFYCPPDGDTHTAHWRLRLFLRWVQKRVIYKQCGDPHGGLASENLYDALLDVVLQHGKLAHPAVAHESR